MSEAARQSADTLPLAVLLSTLGGALIALQTGYQFQGNLPSWVVGSIASASLLLNDPRLYLRTSELLASADALVKDIKANPKKYINVSVF